MIKGTKINLRVIDESDLDELISLENDTSTVGQFSELHIVSPGSFKKKYHETGFWQYDYGRLLITDKENNILGKIMHFKSYKYSTGVELGATIYDPSNRSKGYVSEAIQLFSAYLYETMSIDRIELSTEPDNIGAQKVALKAGFVYEGTRRNACKTRGELVDLQMYSLLKSDVKKLKDVMEK